jgi:hypothetical protein
MKSISTNQVTNYVENNIGEFHRRRLTSLSSLKLETILKRKNPYLFKAKNIQLSQDLVRILVDAFLSSQEETIFGDFLEGLARFINGYIYGGQKSSATGLDLEFVKNDIRYLVDIKSGPNWGNSSQIKKMKENFKTAKIIVRQRNPDITVVTVNGCCYGRDNNPDKGDYYKYCGQRFWEFISGDDSLYLELIVPLGHKAKEKNEEFQKEYAKLINMFTIEFSKKYCVGGEINWEKLLKLNSAK